MPKSQHTQKKTPEATKRKKRRKPGRPPKQDISSNPDHMSVEELMLRVATELFAEKGYEAVTIREIADRSNVTLSSLYHYFGDKRSLYIQAHRREFQRSSSRIAEAIHTGETAALRLVSFTIEMCRINTEAGPIHKMISRHLLENDAEAIALLARETATQPFTQLRDLVTEIVPQRQAMATASAIYALCHGLASIRPIEDALHWATGVARSPEGMAEFVLISLLPEINWRTHFRTFARQQG